MKNNKKVPIAILSCFLIAFVLQGILKLSGVFIFEKALGWGIFKAIDNARWLQIIYYGTINLISMYCLSFALTSKPYSKKWYHYLILVFVAYGITTCRILIKTPMAMEFIYDAITYITTPVIINLTSNKEYRLFKDNKFTNIIVVIAIQILLYFCYLGLGYWSALLCSIIPAGQSILYASSSFLVRFETYIGLALLMFSLNICIDKFKEK